MHKENVVFGEVLGAGLLADMAAAMEQAGAPYEFVHYTDRGHMPIEGEVIKRSREFIDLLCAASGCRQP